MNEGDGQQNGGNGRQNGGKGEDLAEYRQWLQSVKETYEANSRKYSAKRVERMRKSMVHKVKTAIGARIEYSRSR